MHIAAHRVPTGAELVPEQTESAAEHVVSAWANTDDEEQPTVKA